MQSNGAGQPQSKPRQSLFWLYLLLGLLLIVAVSVRLRVASMPLERDEGEYALMGQLILQGIPPYTAAANLKFPGTYLCYAVIEQVFGQTPEGIRYGLLVINLATVVLVGRLARLLLGDSGSALTAAAIYLLSTLSFVFLGPMAHATHFVVFWGVLSLLICLEPRWRNHQFAAGAAGAMAAAAILCKQSGYFFLPIGLLGLFARSGWSLRSPDFRREALCFCGGATCLAGATAAWLYATGAFEGFVFWTLRYAAHYAPVSLHRAWEIFLGHSWLMLTQSAGWFVFVPALWGLCNDKRKASTPPAGYRRLVFVALALAFTGVCAGFYFRAHYWIQALPFLAILTAAGLANFASWIARVLPNLTHPQAKAVLLVGLSSIVIAHEYPRFFFTAPDAISREIYGGNPFAAAREVGNYLARESRPEDRIFVFGCEPEIYFHACRLPAADNLYPCYNLVSPHPLQQAMFERLVRQLEANPPRYFVDANVRFFSTEADRNSELYRWRTNFLTAHYRPKLMVDLREQGQVVVRAELMASYVSDSDIYLAIWERSD